MSSIAIITARGGSRRIPKKNIRDFLGQPIIDYSIHAARESEIFDDVMVSTDSEEIADIARSAGASVPFLRSEKTSGDFATTADVIREVLERMREEGREYESFCCIYPTAPFVTAEKLRRARNILEEKKADAVVTVVKFSFPPQRCFVEDAQGMISYRWPEYASRRSQDLEPLYHDAGQFYLVKTAAFEAENTVIPKRTSPLILPETQVQDIDNPDDWEIAEIKYRRLMQQ